MSRVSIKELSTLQHQIIELAWKDDVSFGQIKKQFGYSESEVKVLMRRSLKKGSYVLWRKRVNRGACKKSVHKAEK